MENNPTPPKTRTYAMHKGERIEVIGEDSSDNSRVLILSSRGFTSYVPKSEIKPLEQPVETVRCPDHRNGGATRCPRGGAALQIWQRKQWGD